jgi:hypothetical protein
MNKRLINIQKIVAVFLLIIFAFSLAPKKLLHDLVANHKDARYASSSIEHQFPIITKSVFHCPVDSQVVESPFEYFQQNSSSIQVVFSASKNFYFKKEYHYYTNSVITLRGPPALA